MERKIPDYRGRLRLLILHILAEGPKHGYGIMKELKNIIGHCPGSGAIYPQLHYLKAKGYVKVEDTVEGGRLVKVYTLTEKGREYLSSKEKELNETLRLLRSVRELQEMGLAELVRRMRELATAIPDLPPEAKARVRAALRKFLLEIDSIIMEYGK